MYPMVFQVFNRVNKLARVGDCQRCYNTIKLSSWGKSE
ncbi:hypothetical protein F383_00748 [Gossypium arboreum]|uniref:Uncharacterized protein n=1 Tax=Gossypium arboreum TaxID=29729 RepID=A0A0B0PEB0_GOSAR|nr:hypothetical protein F383_00748 [Gossypium arboreum]